MKKMITFMIVLVFLFSFASLSVAKERSGEVTIRVNLNAPVDSKEVRLWVPYPVSDENQSIYDVNISGNFAKSGIYREGENGNIALYAEWSGALKERILIYSFKVTRKEAVRKDFKRKELPFSREEYEKYLMPTTLGTTSGKVKALALKITTGKKTNLDKARSIYDWLVKNMYRDPNIKGCGYGEVEKLIVSLGGKCGDIHSVFVALSRSVGVPAREIFGIRMPKDNEGDMTKSQHCWAEFYMPGYGWIPVDPSDVRKAMLEKKITDLNEVKDLVEYFFGAVDESRIAYQKGRDVVLNPAQQGEKLNYFMYPYAETDGKPLNEDLFGFNLGYKISFRGL